MSDIDEDPSPVGTLTLQTLAMPADTGPNSNISGGWLMSQMDLAGAICAHDYAQGRVTTVAVSAMAFLRPIPVGTTVSCYAQMLETGRSSIQILVEVWVRPRTSKEVLKVTEGEFVYVAIDGNGRTRSLPVVTA
ncbi:acyl-CoA thioesterase [Proteobacteria bacterium 005FR1]|nr:acyl-CoA thioesterase [Proteobacteria bacterium 005FR1]